MAFDFHAVEVPKEGNHPHDTSVCEASACSSFWGGGRLSIHGVTLGCCCDAVVTYQYLLYLMGQKENALLMPSSYQNCQRNLPPWQSQTLLGSPGFLLHILHIWQPQPGFLGRLKLAINTYHINNLIFLRSYGGGVIVLGLSAEKSHLPPKFVKFLRN